MRLPRRASGGGPTRSSLRRSTARRWPATACPPGTIALLYLGEVTRPRGWTEQAEREAGRAIALFEQSDDRVGLAHSWRVIAHVYNRRQWAELERVGERIVGYARRAGDRRTETRILGGISASLCLGPTPAGEAVERCERILVELGGAPRPTMMVLDSLALCSAMLERFDEAERLLARADAIREELTGKLWKVGRVEFSAWTYLLAGRPGDAERVLRPAYEAFARIGEKGEPWRSTQRCSPRRSLPSGVATRRRNS